MDNKDDKGNTNDNNKNGENKVKTAYRAATELYNKELDRLFQRLNFFLLGSSFLIIALVTLANHPQRLFDFNWLLLYGVIIGGLSLSVFFFVINLRMSRYLGRMLHYLYKLEKGESISPMFPYLASKQLDTYIDKGEKVSCVAHNTWIVPIGFTVFWSAVLGTNFLSVICKFFPPCFHP